MRVTELLNGEGVGRWTAVPSVSLFGLSDFAGCGAGYFWAGHLGRPPLG
jgi:hypothetical protein